jgi:hypothetical protein
LTIGAFLGGATVAQFGYKTAFVLNAASFLFSAICIWQLRSPTGDFKPRRGNEKKHKVRPVYDYAEGLRYIRSVPLLTGILLIAVGWASGGGAAQILFPLFGEVVFRKGAVGIGVIWGSAGAGLLIGGILAHTLGKRLDFESYKRTIAICYLIHGSTYVIFSQMRNFGWALVFIAVSRAAVAISSVLNYMQLFRHVSDQFRGRVFASIETATWSIMMISMMLAGIASQFWDPRAIGACSGVISSTTAIFWAWANWTGRLPEPAEVPHEEAEVEELHGEARS